MPLKIVCPNCQKALTAKEELAGRVVRCPRCKNPLTVPASNAATSRPAAAVVGSSSSLGGDDFGAADPSSPCPGCGKSLSAAKVVCIDCGYNRKLGRKMATQNSHTASARPPSRRPQPGAAAPKPQQRPARRRQRSGGPSFGRMFGGLGLMALSGAWIGIVYIGLHKIPFYALFMFIGGLYCFLTSFRGD
jgi:DNA-directed RNA polymerase subunit M/transcription elongation factor TFIIS